MLVYKIFFLYWDNREQKVKVNLSPFLEVQIVHSLYDNFIVLIIHDVNVSTQR